jgi:CubicO group peptidase (beta-lactamase class C family)
VNRKRLPFVGIVAFGLVSAAHAQAPAETTPPVDLASSPGATWETIAPESVSFSSVYLEALTTFLKAHHTTSMVVAVHGKITYQYGDTSKVSVIASVRKSVLSMLYGNYVQSGKIDTQKTVKQIGLDDKQPFLPIEENSKLAYLLAGRSGILIVPEKPDPSSADSYQPKRGTELPGNFFTYNEWDFNAAGTAFEKLTGKDIYDALETDLARAIGMQDFDRARQKKNSNLPFSVHPQYPMYLSTRDMARLGQLMLRQGNWNGKQVMPADWVRYTTTLWTPFQDMHPGFRANMPDPTAGGSASCGSSGTNRVTSTTPGPGPCRAPSSRWGRAVSTSPCCRGTTWSSRTKSISTLRAARSIPSNGTQSSIWF